LSGFEGAVSKLAKLSGFCETWWTWF